MPICEVESKYRLGNVGIGSKPGRILNVGECVILWTEPDIAFGGVYGQRIEVVAPDKVRLVSFNDNTGLITQPEADLVSEEINRNRDIKRKVCWIPEK